MQTMATGGTIRNYIHYEKEIEKDKGCFIGGLSKDKAIHTTVRRCIKCHRNMLINKKSKKEWCEYCDRA